MPEGGTTYRRTRPVKKQDLEAIRQVIAEMMQAQSQAPKGKAMVTLTARVPPEFIAFLDSLGPSRSEALRDILREAQIAKAAATTTRKK